MFYKKLQKLASISYSKVIFPYHRMAVPLCRSHSRTNYTHGTVVHELEEIITI